MGSVTACVNCGSPLPRDKPGHSRYCEKCTTSWNRGNASASQTAGQENTTPTAVARHCDNCGAPLSRYLPANQAYCDTCAATWQRGKAARSEPTP